MLLRKESVLSFEEKTTRYWFTYFQIDFSLGLLGYRTEFSCLYLPQENNFISNVWL